MRSRRRRGWQGRLCLSRRRDDILIRSITVTERHRLKRTCESTEIVSLIWEKVDKPIIDNSLDLLISLQTPCLAYLLELYQDASQVIVKLADLQSLNGKILHHSLTLNPSSRLRVISRYLK